MFNVRRAWGELVLQEDPFFTDPDFEQELFDRVASAGLPNNATCVDVGGHQGLWATFLSVLRPLGVVYTFEPNPANQTILLHNIKHAGTGNIFLAPYALGSTDGPDSLHCWDVTLKAGGSGCHQLRQSPGDLPTYEVPVLVRRLDALDLNPDFIKVDVEHWELEVLKGAEKTLRYCRPSVLIECHNNDLSYQVEAFLKGLGYTPERFTSKTVPTLNLTCTYLWCS